MRSYLSKENPYIYSALGKKYVTKEKLTYTKGAYDATIKAKYDEKDYPYTDGTYYGASIEKPTEFGIDLSAGYRYAYGVQEYNNIKTGKNGEFLFGAKIPLVAVLNQIDKRRLQVGLVRMDLAKTEFEYKEAMRNFYFTLMSNYYTLLYNNSLLEVSKSMLEKLKKRQKFLQKSVAEGQLPEIALLEVQQQLLNAQQDYISTKRSYENKCLEFLKYLNLTKDKFEKHYHLPTLPDIDKQNFSLQESLSQAKKNRPDIKILNTEIEKLLLENKNNERMKYPEFNFGLYGVYDVNKKSGFKLSLDISIPIERNRYKGKSAQIRENIKIINNTKDIQLLELKADLESVINSLNTVVENIQNARAEIKLLEKLETVEARKYELGSSTLFLLNQREMLTMSAYKKILKYKLEYHLLYEAYKRIIAQHSLDKI
jgi:outer membrane protein TolC